MKTMEKPDTEQHTMNPSVIQVSTPNIYSVNKVLVQQIIETIGGITKNNIDINPVQMLSIESMILEFYRQITRYLFNLEVEEQRQTGQITIYPELCQEVSEAWDTVWKAYTQLHKD